MLAFIYLTTALGTPPPLLVFVRTLILFTIATIGIATFGYLMNDLTDIPQDQRSGAHNVLASMKPANRGCLFVLVLALGITPWLWLPINRFIIFLLVSEYLLFALYSVPPIRLKGRGAWGAIADSLYAYVITCLVAMSVFAEISNSSIHSLALLAGMWLFAFGLNGIIKHQLLDSGRDQVDRIRTLAIALGWPQTLCLLRNTILPLNYLLLIAVIFRVTGTAPIILIVFVANHYFVLRQWKRESLAQAWALNALTCVAQVSMLSEHLVETFVYRWLPPLCLITLVIHDPRYLPLMIVHFVAFPRPLKDLIQELNTTSKRLGL